MKIENIFGQMIISCVVFLKTSSIFFNFEINIVTVIKYLSFYFFNRNQLHFVQANDLQRKWIVYVNHFEIHSVAAKIDYRKPQNRISGRRMKVLFVQQPVCSLLNIWDVLKCLNPVGCKCAKKQLKF